MDAVAVFFSTLRIILGFLLVFFIPGFILTFLYFPYSTDLRLMNRLIYSIILSISCVLVLVLIMESLFGVNTTPLNIFLFICAFSALSLVIWHFKKKYMNLTLKLPFNNPLARLLSWDYHAPLKYYSRIANSIQDRIRKTDGVRIVYHENLTSGSNQIDHSCLIDIGEEIEIQQIIEYNRKVCDCILLTPPHPKTRYFELFIREYADEEISRIEDLQVYPVIAEKNKPSGKIPELLYHNLNWNITGRLFKQAGATKIQWIYHHDFDISSISRPQDTVDETIDRVIDKIVEIIKSIKRGSPITSHIEGHLKRRKAFVAEMEKYECITKTRIEIGPLPEFQPLEELDERDCRKLQYDVLQDLVELGVKLENFTSSQRFKAKFEISKNTDINKQLSDINKNHQLDDLFE